MDSEPGRASSGVRDARGRAAAFFWRPRSLLAKLGLLAALIVITAVGVLLLVPALLIGGAVLLVVTGIARLRQRLSRVLPDRSGRKNVRVIGGGMGRRNEAPL